MGLMFQRTKSSSLSVHVAISYVSPGSTIWMFFFYVIKDSFILDKLEGNSNLGWPLQLTVETSGLYYLFTMILDG